MAAANAALETSASTGSSVFSDEEIVRRVLAGEAASYDVLIRRHNQRLPPWPRATTGQTTTVLRQKP